MANFFYLTIATLLIKYVYTSPDRIAGGKSVIKGQFPFFAQLLIVLKLHPNGSTHTISCGGSLIHPEWILTAAHCFKMNEMTPPEMFKKDHVKAFMGSEKVVQKLISPDHVVRNIGMALLHPYYVYEEIETSQLAWNDIALALLKYPFTLNRYINVIKLPEITTTLCRVGTVIGAGIVKFGGDMPKVTQYCTIHTKTIHEISLVPDNYQSDIFYSEVAFSGSYVLQGDSGGPFVCSAQDNVSNVLQFGVLSGGINNNLLGTRISMFEAVDKHMTFITHHVPIVQTRITMLGNSASTRTISIFLIVIAIVISVNILLHYNLK